MNALTGARPAATALERRRLLIRGLVQGVGFRPHVYRTAVRHGVSGFVCNGPAGVTIEAEGAAVDAFIADLRRSAPPLARIDSLLETSLPALGDNGFTIRETRHDGVASAAIPADVGLCEDCLGELFDPGDRRYLHPFIACTNCGPRFTMTRRLPYDRVNTSMADFALCPACEREYTDPASRRFHAEPVACPDCGPILAQDIDAVAATIRRGGIVAVKGVGGFHLACDARNHSAVQNLRERKRRDGKPFAVMVANVASARQLVELEASAEQLLGGQERPVVVLPAQAGNGLSPALSPGLDTLGLLLPYTAIHYLLFHALLGRPAGTAWLRQPQSLALVMTSANLGGEPLIIDNAQAHRELPAIAELVVDHDREISARADDSVLRVVDRQPLFIRRARGYVPNAIPLSRPGPDVLALGAHLKNTITLTRGDLAYLSRHVGDLDSPATVNFLEQTVRELGAMLQTEPARIACDWHRDYASTRLAEQLRDETGAPLVRVQHHHAHIAAVLAVHGCERPVLGIALDGHGQGERGESWGGELLRVDGADFERLGHFAPLPAPGGDAAAREPWRMAAGVLHSLGRGAAIPQRFPEQSMAPALARLLAGEDVPQTTAAGRLFDAAAGLLGVSQVAAFEGEPPMQLESLVRRPRVLADGFTLRDGVLDFAALLAALADCNDATEGAELLHGTLIEALCRWTLAAAERSGLDTVALAGGCFLNAWLAGELPARLRAAGLQVLSARDIPPNDGSISLGQAWVAQRTEGAQSCV